MTRTTHCFARPTLAALGMRWLALMVISLGMMVSSIGLTSSHGTAAIAESHQSELSFAAGSDKHAHANEIAFFTGMVGGSNVDQADHSLDHSHDTGHCPPHMLNATGSLRPEWAPMMRPRIAPGQAFRLDRPPMV